MKRRLLAFFTVAFLTNGFLAFGFFGSATSVAQDGLARSFGAAVDLTLGTSTSSLISPLPLVTADKTTTEAERALVRLADIPAGPTSLIDEIAALYVTGRVDVEKEMAIATSDTARVALLESPDVPAQLPGLNLDDLLGLVGTIGKLQPPAAVPLVSTSPTILADALHGIVTMSCPQLETLRSASTLARLQEITKGSVAQQVKIKGVLDTKDVALPVLGNINTLNVDLSSGLPAGKERAAAYNLRIDLPAIEALGIKAGTRLLELSIYEVNAENLKAANLREATVRTSVDMLHVTVLDKVTNLLEVDIKVGHAETSLSRCAPPPSVESVPFDKLVDAIDGVRTVSQIGLTAKPGDVVDYGMPIRNNSTNGCVITKIVDHLPAGFSPASANLTNAFGTGVYNAADRTVTWNNMNLRAGQGLTGKLPALLSASIPTGTYFNRAVATGSTPSGACGPFEARAPGIQVLGDITVDVLKTISSIGGITVTPSTSLTAKPGQEVLYKLLVTNTSRESCTISQVVDQLPEGFAMSSTAGQLGAGTYDSVANTITWDGLEIAPGESAEQGIVTEISTSIRPGRYRNRATATGSCGTFEGRSPAITVSGVLGNIVRRTGPTPRTGINDQLMWFGPLLLVVAVVGTTVLRRSR